MKTLTSAMVLSVSLAAPAVAHEFTIGDLVIDHPVSFATAPGAQAGAGYMTITNNGDEAQSLISAAADFPAVQIHLSSETDGVMRMEEQDAVVIGAGETVAFAPGGYHIMFMGLGDDALETGEEIPVTLEFEGLGTVDVVFNVEERSSDHGEMSDDEMDHADHGDHGDMAETEVSE